MTDLEGVRVGALEWSEDGVSAETGLGFTYEIMRWDDGTASLAWRVGGRFESIPGGKDLRSVIACQQHAQIDFERRILSALEPSPSCPHCGGECGGSNGWCADMSKAPRDGRTILIHRYGGVTGQFLARWWTFEGGLYGRWQTFSSHGSSDYPGEPHCWQPAPTPPAQEQSA